jgi:hypothetical protein
VPLELSQSDLVIGQRFLDELTLDSVRCTKSGDFRSARHAEIEDEVAFRFHLLGNDVEVPSGLLAFGSNQRFHPIEALVHQREAFVNASELLVNLLEPVVDARELLADLRELPLDVSLKRR